MLKRLYANKASFRPIVFKDNSLNIILAEKHGDAATASRNGLGKSTFVNIIAFCFGLNVDERNDLPLSELAGWAWTLEFSVGDKVFSVTRSADTSRQIKVLGDLSNCPVHGQVVSELGGEEYSIFDEKSWRQVLCWLLFTLTPGDMLGEGGNAQPPEYQSLISHFIRRHFDDPVRVKWSDSKVAAELAITYLLGLDWQFLASAKELRKKNKMAEAVIDSAKTRMSQWRQKRNAMEAECKKLESDIRAAEAGLSKYNTVPQAQLVKGSLDEYTKRLNKVEKEIIRTDRLIKSARDSSSINYVSSDPIVRFYEEIGRVFTGGAKRSLEEVRKFHDGLTKNRASLIAEQIQSLSEKRKRLDEEWKRLSREKDSVVAAISANSAFEDYKRRTEALNTIRKQLALKQDCLRQLDEGEEQKKLNEQIRTELVRRAEETNEQLKDTRDREDAFFASVINRLYSEAIPERYKRDTSLGMRIRNDGGDCGISYEPHFWGDRSLGKKKLKAFAFDLTILKEQHAIGTAVDFMLHDSVLYESSDSRQYAKALAYVAEICEKEHFQYIGVMNSDDVSTDDFKAILPREKLETFVIHRLTDDPSGKETLLGEFFPRE